MCNAVTAIPRVIMPPGLGFRSPNVPLASGVARLGSGARTIDPDQGIQETVTYRRLAQWLQRLRASDYDQTEIAPKHLFGCDPGRLL